MKIDRKTMQNTGIAYIQRKGQILIDNEMGHIIRNNTILFIK